MTEERYELSRRKILAGIGAMGVASAGAGMGTSAYFSDEETFTNNQLEAGELDLKVAVSQHYVDWLAGTDTQGVPNQADPIPAPQETDDARMPESDETPDIWLQAGSSGADTKARPIELVLEQDDDESDDFDGDDEPALEFAVGSKVNDINGGVPPGGYSGSLCNIDAGGDDDDAERPIVQLDDVKPGDFGFVRFAFASCDNPAFVQVEGEVTDKHENGTTEPEAEDPDEEDGSVELLDEVRIALVDDDLYQRISGGSSDGDTEVDLAPGDGFAGSASTLRALDAEGGARERLDGDIDPEDGGGSSAAENNCFSAETNHYYSLVWWLPIDHANEIQSDSVTFELGLYAEQCRHNDGIGTTDEPECPDPRGDEWTPICDWNDLYNIRDGSLDGFGLDGKYYLVRDLDENSAGYDARVKNPSGGWNPIGKDEPDSSDKTFIGTFDGDGHTIEGLKIDRRKKDGVGLFARTDGTVKDVGIERANITGDEGVGVLVGKQIGGTVKRAYATGSVTGGFSYTGGLVGINSTDARIKESYAAADVSVGRKGDSRKRNNIFIGEYVGGLVGGISGTVEDSYATGDVESDGEEFDDDGAGGLIGLVSPGAELKRSYATGNVDAPKMDKGAGRLVGINKASIEMSYADSSSSVTGPDGGTIGRTLSNFGGNVGSNVGALSTSKMQGTDAPSNMIGFDFTSPGVWDTVTSPNDDYPVLQALDRQTQLDARKP